MFTNYYLILPQDSLPLKKKKGKHKKNKTSTDSTIHKKENHKTSNDSLTKADSTNIILTKTDSSLSRPIPIYIFPKAHENSILFETIPYLSNDKFTFHTYHLSLPENQTTNTNILIRNDSTLQSANQNSFLPEKEYLRFKTDWLIIALIGSLLIFGWIYAFYRKFFVQIFHSAYDEKISSKLMEERSTITERVSLALNILFLLTGSLFVYESSVFYNIHLFGLSGIGLFGFYIGVLSIVYLFKFLFYSFIGITLQRSYEMSEYLHNIFLYCKIFGISLFPIIICLPFSGNSAHIWIKIGGILYCISLMFRFFRGLQLSIKINFSIFYLILYLCAVEILPILLLGKFFLKLIHS